MSILKVIADWQSHKFTYARNISLKSLTNFEKENAY